MANILVVEDESVVALDIIQELEQEGYKVVGHAVTGAEAIQKASQSKPNVVLMDINLKGTTDGIQAAESIVKLTPAPIIIFLTAHADEATLQRAKLTKPFGYIIKPFEPNELKANIEIALYRTGTNVASIASDCKISDEEGDAEIGNTAELFKKLSLFKGIEPSLVNALSKSAVPKEVSPGEYIVSEGTPTSSGFFVLSGRLAVVKSTVEGKELTIDLLPPGDSTGLLLSFEDEAPDVSIRGQIQSRILTVQNTDLRSLAQGAPHIYKNISDEFSRRSRRMNTLALGLAHSTVERRIIATLLSLVPRVGKTSGTTDQAKIFLTRKELADLTGTTPETAIRTTKHLEREGILDLTKPGIIKILSVAQFQKLLEE